MPAFPDATLDAADGLVLSGLIGTDATALVDAFQDAELRKWLPLPSPYTREMATEWCTTTSRELRESGRGFVMAIRDAGILAGSIDAKRVDWRARTAELSYWTAPRQRGRGLMPIAVRRIAEWMLAELDFERIELRIAPANVASLHVAEKVGFQYEGIARNAGFTDAGRVDLTIFSLVKSDIQERVRDYTSIPSDLPFPEDDGAADHLPGMRMPEITLQATDGSAVEVGALGAGRTVLYFYPLTGRPDAELPDGWDAIPGARGCTSEACDFRDHHAALRAQGVQHVWGLSSQTLDYQQEVVERLHLPFAMLSDAAFALADALRLPTFTAPGQPRLYSRLTLVIRDGVIEHAFYPIFPPNEHARQVLDWLDRHPLSDD